MQAVKIDPKTAIYRFTRLSDLNSHDFDDEFCLQLTAEKQVRKFNKGIPKIDWVKTRVRNEALDLVVLGLACYTMLNVNEVRVAQKLSEVREEKPGKVQRRRNWVSRW